MEDILFLNKEQRFCCIFFRVSKLFNKNVDKSESNDRFLNFPHFLKASAAADKILNKSENS